MKERLVVDGKGTEREVGSPIPNIPKENIIALPDKKEVRVDWRRVFEQIDNISSLIEQSEIIQEEGTYHLRLDRPEIKAGYVFIFSDPHIGSTTSDHKLIRGILELVSVLPNTCLVDAGDTFDNGIWGGLQFEQAIPPYLQAFTIKDIARELGEKYAAMVLANHPEWLFYRVGQRPEDLFYQEVKGPIFPGMGLLHLKVGDQEYDVALAHTYWGRSKKNIFNVCVNFRNHEYPNADVFIVGHEHIWGHGTETVNGRERLYIRPGTAKIKDRYARIHGIARRGQKMGLAVKFYADKHYFEAIPIWKAKEEIEKYL